MIKEDLMLNDWVQCQMHPDGPYRYVKLGSLDFLDYYECIAIPITPKILKKNGFTKEDYKYKINELVSIYEEDDCSWKLEIIINYRFGLKIYIPILFVHELQHALRLAKIKMEIEL